MIQLTPGLSLLSRVIPRYIVSSALAYALLELSQNVVKNQRSLPPWITIVICALAHPLYLLAQSYYIGYRNARKAAAMSAGIVPKVKEGWPVAISNVRKMLSNLHDGYPGDFMLSWIEQYGHTYEVSLPLDCRIFTFEPDHVKAILATQFDSFENGPVAIEQAKSLLGTGVFNSDGDMWKFHRTMTRPFFTRERISDFEIFGAHADDALRQAKVRLAEGYPIDFQDLVARFTLDSATEFLFGDNVHSLSAGLAYPESESSSKPNQTKFDSHPSNRFISAFSEAQLKASLRSRTGKMWPLQEIFSDKIYPHRKVVDEYIAPLMENAIRKKWEYGSESKEAGNVLDHLVQRTEDRTVILDELLNLLVAGRDTTASLLTFSVYMMAEHPDMTERLREEIISKIGSTNHPTYQDIREMKYLKAFLNEVLRLYPPVPFNSRMSNRDTVLHSSTPGVPPFFIPAQTRCMYGVFLIHRRTDLWGPDALEFDPDRFIDERLAKYLVPNPYIFCPFNAGPRICLGQQFAYQEASFFMIRLLQQFSSFSLASDAQPADSLPPHSWIGASGRKAVEKVRPQQHLTMAVKGGLWVRMQEATVNENA